MTATSEEPSAFWKPGPLLISVTSPQPTIPHLIDIELEPPRSLHCVDVLGRCLGRPTSLCLNDLRQGPLHVGGHTLLVAADEHLRAFLEPGEDVASLLAQAVLDVDLVRLIAGERQIETQHAALLPRGHL